MKNLAQRIKDFTKDEIKKLETDKSFSFTLDGNDVSLSLDDVEIISTEIEGWVVESENGITVAIDSELTNELIGEGFAREFVNRVQNMRKSAGLEITDRIKVNYACDSELANHIEHFRNYINNEVLADSLINNIDGGTGYTEELTIGEFEMQYNHQ